MKKVTDPHPKLSVLRNSSKMGTGKSDASSKDQSSISKFSPFQGGLVLAGILGQNKIKSSQDDFGDRASGMLDKLFSKYSSEKNVKNITSNTIGLAKTTDFDFYQKMEKVNSQMNKLVITSPKEEGDKFQLVGKYDYENLKKENGDLTKKIQELTDQIKEMKTNLFRSSGESFFLNQVNDAQKKLSSDNSNRLKALQNNLTESEKESKRLQELLTEETIEKDSLYNALINFTKRYDTKMAKELATIYQSFNNQYYLSSIKPIDDAKIEELLGKIYVLEKELSWKSKEIEDLKMFLIPKASTKLPPPLAKKKSFQK